MVSSFRLTAHHSFQTWALLYFHFVCSCAVPVSSVPILRTLDDDPNSVRDRLLHDECSIRVADRLPKVCEALSTAESQILAIELANCHLQSTGHSPILCTASVVTAALSSVVNSFVRGMPKISLRDCDFTDSHKHAVFTQFFLSVQTLCFGFDYRARVRRIDDADRRLASALESTASAVGSIASSTEHMTRELSELTEQQAAAHIEAVHTQRVVQTLSKSVTAAQEEAASHLSSLGLGVSSLQGVLNAAMLSHKTAASAAAEEQRKSHQNVQKSIGQLGNVVSSVASIGNDTAAQVAYVRESMQHVHNGAASIAAKQAELNHTMVSLVADFEVSGGKLLSMTGTIADSVEALRTLYAVSSGQWASLTNTAYHVFTCNMIFLVTTPSPFLRRYVYPIFVAGVVAEAYKEFLAQALSTVLFCRMPASSDGLGNVDAQQSESVRSHLAQISSPAENDARAGPIVETEDQEKHLGNTIRSRPLWRRMVQLIERAVDVTWCVSHSLRSNACAAVLGCPNELGRGIRSITIAFMFFASTMVICPLAVREAVDFFSRPGAVADAVAFVGWHVAVAGTLLLTVLAGGRYTRNIAAIGGFSAFFIYLVWFIFGPLLLGVGAGWVAFLFSPVVGAVVRCVFAPLRWLWRRRGADPPPPCLLAAGSPPPLSASRRGMPSAVQAHRMQHHARSASPHPVVLFPEGQTSDITKADSHGRSRNALPCTTQKVVSWAAQNHEATLESVPNQEIPVVLDTRVTADSPCAAELLGQDGGGGTPAPVPNSAPDVVVTRVASASASPAIGKTAPANDLQIASTPGSPDLLSPGNVGAKQLSRRSALTSKHRAAVVRTSSTLGRGRGR
eukprot:TRINITY_DN57358_c0_g1_i1.p1 TRINITY_DN57358_c0_g1~~TRINITY_DN57358_c0_g1_i1.p1  ORF type:complete len:848 (+),score=-3.43 TRINITY_DN57358_c0_g1_i1:98-2641(+)